MSVMAATSGGAAQGSRRRPSIHGSSASISSGSSDQPRRAGAMPTCTPPSTPLAMSPDSVSASSAPGRAAQPEPSSRARSANVHTPGARYVSHSNVWYAAGGVTMPADDADTSAPRYENNGG